MLSRRSWRLLKCVRWLERFSDWKVEELKRRRRGAENRRVRYIYLSVYLSMASVWKNRGSIDLLTAKPSTSSTEIIPDDDSCDICCGEDGACDVYFSPCGHKACASCVQRMRIANIYKVISNPCECFRRE